MEYTLTEEQVTALQALKTGENIFLSGAAGTGKSYVLHCFLDWASAAEKKVVITAPTGIAAVNVNGSTIHKVFGSPQLGKEITRARSKVLNHADIVVIDEISMCRVDLFDQVIRTMDYLNSKRLTPIQLVVCGDFGQLPPVVKNEDVPVLKEFFPNSSDCFYAFEHPKWRFHKITLTKVIRQRDDARFAEALNQIRVGDLRGLTYINEKRSKKKIPEAIHIVARNKEADEENQKKIAKLKIFHIFESEVTGQVGSGDKPVPDSVKLAVNARVISVVNDPDNAYVNGSQGTIRGFQTREDGETSVSVLFDNGNIVDISRYKWTITKPELVVDSRTGKKRIEQIEQGSYTQIPLKLGYAVTIHKSQGQTYSSVNARLGSWDPGQLYTQLSRVNDVAHLYLSRDLTEDDVIVSSAFRKFELELVNREHKAEPEIVFSKKEKRPNSPLAELLNDLQAFLAEI